MIYCIGICVNGMTILICYLVGFLNGVKVAKLVRADRTEVLIIDITKIYVLDSLILLNCTVFVLVLTILLR